MKKSIIITEKNISNFFIHENDDKLKINDIIYLEKSNVPCVRYRKGFKDTFSIYRSAHKKEKYKHVKGFYYWHFNRYVVNDKFTK